VLVHDFLEGSARRHPEKTALVCGRERWTYAQLDAQANRLGRALADNGVQRGDRVVIHLQNSPAAVVSIFAALKAGAVFVPLHPTAKADKLNFVLTDCRATALVTELEGAGWPRTAWLRTVVNCALAAKGTEPSAQLVLDYREVQDRWPAVPPSCERAEEDLACLIYTSGSTGRPKGVMCEHRQVVFVSGSIIEYLENVESDIVLNVLPLSFDYGLYQLLMTFRFGGTLVLEKSFAYPASVLQRIAQERVTGLPGVPTTFSLLLGLDLGACDLSSLRYLTNTGAALPPSHVLELRRRFPQARLYSMYGLTETKRTLYLPPAELDRRPGSVGRPIPGTQAWIEDASGRRLGPGELGQLVICGPHVMRGYWEDPQATAARFRPGPEPGQRLCYSGDLFRQDADGYFYFVGRTDDIIKSRGEKVPPKEVENVLYELPGIKEAAVVGVADPVLGQAVKAFVAFRSEPLPVIRILAHCRARLEEFMVPKQVEIRASLPRTSSGKIDKLALCSDTSASGPTEPKEGPVTRPAPAQIRANGARTDAPRTLWRTAGDLLALQHQVRPLKRYKDDSPAPLSFAQERLWQLERAEPGAAYYHVSLAWEVAGELDVEALERSLDFLVQRHEALRTSFAATATGPIQTVSNHRLKLMQAETVASGGVPPREVAMAQAREFLREPFDLLNGPLVRANLYRYGAQKNLLAFVVHQTIFDGASMRLLSAELAQCYRSFARGITPQLAPLPVRYSDFSRWQRECLQGNVLETALEFWRGQLARPYEPLRLPTDYPRRNAGITPGAQTRIAIPEALAAGLKNLAKAQDTTPFVALLGSFQAFLSAHTRQEDVLALVTVAGRHQPELRNLIGLVANVLPFRLDLSGRPDFREVLARTANLVSSALAHQLLPLHRILELLPSGSRHTDTAPPTQVLLLYNSSPLPTLRLPGVTFTPTSDVDNGTARFDLLLDLADSRQGITGHLKYRSDLFKSSTIDSLIQSWLRFIERSVSNPQLTLDAVQVSLGALATSRVATSPTVSDEGESRLGPMEAIGQKASAGVEPGQRTPPMNRARAAGFVAQVFNLLYRRFPIGRPHELPSREHSQPPLHARTNLPLPLGTGEGRGEGSSSLIGSSSQSIRESESGPSMNRANGNALARLLPLPFGRGEGRGEGSVRSSQFMFTPQVKKTWALSTVQLDRQSQEAGSRGRINGTTPALSNPARNELERSLVRIWESVFDLRPIGIQDNFFGLGGHSLLAVKLIAAIEAETGKKLRLSTIFQEPTIARLAEAMQRPNIGVQSSIVEIQPGGEKPPLFLVHGVGGGMFWGYNKLARELGPHQPMFGFKSRGLDGQEEFATIEEMAAQYAAELRQFQPQGPYYLGGYCFGGNVAYEMARQLTAQGQEIALLLLINCWPSNSSYTRITWTPRFLAKALWNFCLRLQHQIRRGASQPRDYFNYRTAWVGKRLKAMFSRHPEDRLAVEDIVDLSPQPEHERQLWRTHVQAWLHYQPQPYGGRLYLFRTRGHPLLCSFDHQMGWGSFAKGGVIVKVCPGDHESILEEENVRHTARQLKAVLDEVQSQQAPSSTGNRQPLTAANNLPSCASDPGVRRSCAAVPFSPPCWPAEGPKCESLG